MSYQDVAHMILACKGAPAMPFVRVPDATEGDIRKRLSIWERPGSSSRS